MANNHIATISGGTFDSTTGPAVYSRHYDGEANDGTLTISGGTFTSTGSHAVALLTSGAKADITGGTLTLELAATVFLAWKEHLLKSVLVRIR